MNVCLHQVQSGEYQQGAVAKPFPGQNPHLMTLCHQTVNQHLADETGASQNAYSSHRLIIMRGIGFSCHVASPS